ncbi:tRNA (N(6)-L-threonylcarbamoyladenosine(37)-C(2))-methylthiotransferase MtaB, partial [bacterium]|nr:tRNA (N(6)-L-threonylcarbamoyladenosine(37)-C(2))-methylthiotransferase MtaB [bacterium]
MALKYKVSITTLGCRLNQAESAQLTELLSKNEYEIVPVNEPADICVLNTCAVTAKAASRARQAIRRLQRLAPQAVIVVAGCYAEVAADEIAQIPGVDFVLGSDYKYDLLRFLKQPEKKEKTVIRTCGYDNHPEFVHVAPGYFLEHTRAFLKIQDGCNGFCSYCIVPYARGKIRSSHIDATLAEARQLVARGFKEIVLTGAHIGLFGKERKGAASLTDLLVEMLKLEGDFRIRLSSIEPLEVTPELLNLMADSEKICPHLHIPLQNGNDDILKAMNRHYNTQQFADLVHQAVEQIPNVAIGTDVMVGFPGETQTQFENMERFIIDLPLHYLHVFAYSVRKGTVAAKMPDRVPKTIMAERSRRLRKISDLHRISFHQSHLGRHFPVLFEEEVQPNILTGLTPNYIRVT